MVHGDNEPIRAPFVPVRGATYIVHYYEDGELKKLFGAIEFPDTGGVYLTRRDGVQVYLPAVHKIEKPGDGFRE
jgi:hypothetical protein